MNLKSMFLRVSDSNYAVIIQYGRATLITPTGAVIRTVGEWGAINAALSPDTKTICVVTNQGKAVLYRAVDGGLIRTLSVPEVTSVTFSGDNIMCQTKSGRSVLVTPFDAIIRSF